MKILWRSMLLLAAFSIKGWAGVLATNFVDFNIEMNGRPARMILVTSFGSSLLLEPGAKRLAMKGDPFSELTTVKSGDKEISVPVVVIQDPLAQLPWFLRQLIKVTHPFLYHEFKGLYDHVIKSLEGVVGWPDIRENILVFDSDHHVIRRVEELPPETANWTKLKVVLAGSLMLELPLADGKKGIAWIDSADSRSVMMPPPRWKEWRKARPNEPLTIHKTWGLPVAISTEHEGWADEAKVGPLTLTDVRVEDMAADDASRLLEYTPMAAESWSLGMGALGRMDLVVDGINGWAYIHPKPPSAIPHLRIAVPAVKRKSFKDGDTVTSWKVADNVRLGSDGFFVRHGGFEWSKQNITNALADFNHALAANPRNPDAYSGRGNIEIYEGKFTEAAADFDKVIELRPDYSEWERLYRQTLVWRLDAVSQKDAKSTITEKPASTNAADLSAVEVVGEQLEGLAGCDYGWPRKLGQFLVGRMDEKALLAEAKKANVNMDPDEQKALADYYIGVSHLSKGDKTGAREWFKKCVAAGQQGDDEYRFAVAELKRLGDDGQSSDKKH